MKIVFEIIIWFVLVFVCSRLIFDNSPQDAAMHGIIGIIAGVIALFVSIIGTVILAVLQKSKIKKELKRMKEEDKKADLIDKGK